MANPSQKTMRAGQNASTSIAIASATGLNIAAGACQASNLTRTARITFTNLVLTHTDNAGSGGYASQKILDFPEGLIRVDGAIFSLTSIVVTTGIASTSASVVCSVGQAAEATGTTLDSTMADVIASTTTGTLVASAAPAAIGACNTAALYLNGTAAAKSLYLNFAVDATDSTANSTITVTGYLDLTYTAFGDK